MWIIYTACVLCTVFFIWQMSARHMEKLGRGWFVRNWISATFAAFIGVFVIAMFSSDGTGWIVLGFIITAVVLSARFSPPSVGAMPNAKEDPPPQPAPAGSLGDIEFDYTNAQGSKSHRKVSVRAVDAEHIEGICHHAREIRTFTISRVSGDVLVCDTGELLSAKDWANSARLDPRNRAVLMSSGAVDVDNSGSEEVAIEILFTGFSKARKDELAEMAEQYGMKVVKSVTKELAYLCVGPSPGPVKVAQATENGVEIIEAEEFLALVS